MNTYLIYKATSPSKKVYIGLTKKTLKERSKEHLWLASSGKARPFHIAIRKYKDSFVWEILEQNLTQSDAEEKEKHYIRLYNSTDRAFGYNLSPGGLAGSIMSEEGKRKHKEKMKLHYANPEFIKKMSESGKKAVSNLEHYIVVSTSAKIYFSNVENSLKHALATGGKHFVCIETVETFISQTLACEKLQIQQSNLWKVLNGKRASTCGYSFKYINKEV